MVSETVKAERHTPESVEVEAVTVLGMIGPKAREAIPTLKKLVRGSDTQLAARAKAALARIE